jgi:hypothetical protein
MKGRGDIDDENCSDDEKIIQFRLFANAYMLGFVKSAAVNGMTELYY